MVRQIVLRMAYNPASGPIGGDVIGLLLTSADLFDEEIAMLGERLLRAGYSARGRYHDVQYRFEMLDHLVPGLEMQTMEIPHATYAAPRERVYGARAESWPELDNLIRESLVHPRGQIRRPDAETVYAAATDHRVRRGGAAPTCSKPPRWVWFAAAAAVVAVVIIAGAS
jgi:hypothetical protein